MPQRSWLVSGVSSCFGRIMTEQLLARGDRIAGTVRNLSVMDDLKEKGAEFPGASQSRGDHPLPPAGAKGRAGVGAPPTLGSDAVASIWRGIEPPTP